MKFILTLLTIISLLIGAAMSNKDTLGSRISDNILKMRQQDGLASQSHRSALRVEMSAEERLMQQMAAARQAIPTACQQSLSSWDISIHQLTEQQKMTTKNLGNAWRSAQLYCRNMPDYNW